MTRSLDGKVAVVTGAGSGIGRGIALRLAEDKAAIAVWDLNPEGAAETVKQIEAAGGKALAITVDCSDKAAIKAAADETRAKFGAITILVNNAGIAPFTPFMDVPEEEFDKVIRINLKGPWLVTREIVPDMLAASWGRIINISGLAARQTGTIPGSARNVAIASLTKNLAEELGPKGINVTVVHPGATRTERTAETLARRAEADGVSEAEAEWRLYGGSLIGRIVEAEEVAAVVAFLASPRSIAINGDAIAAGGGAPRAIHY